MLLETMFREPSQNALSLVCFVYLSSTDTVPVALIVLGFGIDRCILSNCQLDRSHAVGDRSTRRLRVRRQDIGIAAHSFAMQLVAVVRRHA